MKTIINSSIFALALFLGATSAQAQTEKAATDKPILKTYIIEREIPGASAFSPATLQEISKKSCSVLKTMGPGIEWIQSYVAGNKIFCIYKAENEERLREHAKKGGFPANVITEIAAVISPATAE